MIIKVTDVASMIEGCTFFNWLKGHPKKTRDTINFWVAKLNEMNFPKMEGVTVAPLYLNVLYSLNDGSFNIQNLTALINQCPDIMEHDESMQVYDMEVDDLTIEFGTNMVKRVFSKSRESIFKKDND